MLTSFLLPTRTAWVDEDCALVADVADANPLPLVCAVGSVRQLALIADHPRVLRHGRSYQHRNAASSAVSVVTTLVNTLGADAVGTLAAWRDRWCPNADWLNALSVLAEVPGDEAFQVLLDRVDDGSATSLARAARRAAGRFGAAPVRHAGGEPAGFGLPRGGAAARDLRPA